VGARVPARRHERAIDAVLTIGASLVLWQAVYAYAGEAAISSPAATLRYLADLLGTSRFWESFAATMTAFVTAMAISAVLGILLGLGLGLWRFAGEVGEPVIAALYSIPKVTLYPLVLLIFGLGISAKVAFGVIHGVIPIILFTLGAVKTIDPVMLRTARALRLTPAQTVWTVLAPAAMPEMATGLRVGFSLTLLGVLIGEMFASQRGLGFLIINGINLHNVRMTTAVILVVVVFAIVANGLLLWLDHRLVRHI
jgi:NitT/TauT family transport system permease protein